ncbi:AAA family ATPase [Anoxynatronum buryatiense]|uniref:Stage 0 sporulation protein A homolog n=1 Tax=Anoxynatronum buryatiense TaxID=489973 RepID=A0AA45WXP0_9CLOT|nr:response regulator [Anoxynatronum buryatiense]SMP65132.1 pilus assembly protein CpaE [Anoxynatronum buryatiense]
MTPIRVLVTDDIANTREDIKRLLYFEDDMEVVGEAGDGHEAVALAMDLKPDVILMDVNMPGLDGIGATEEISMKVPESAIIIVSIQGEQEYLRKAMAAGAREYMVKPLTSAELAETIRRVHQSQQRRNLQFGGGAPVKETIQERYAKKGKIVSFFCTKGGVGKTTLACNLAVALARQTQKKVALLDLDLASGDVSVMLNVAAKGSIADLVQDENGMDLGLIESYMVPHLTGVQILAAPSSPEQGELVEADHVEKILKILRNHYDYILVDTAPSYSDINLNVLDASDVIALMLNQELTTLKHVKSAREIFATLKYAGRTSIVLNQQNREGIKVKDLETTLDTHLTAAIPEDQRVVRTAINKGQPFVISQPNAGVSISVMNLMEELNLLEGDKSRSSRKNKMVVNRLFNF